MTLAIVLLAAGHGTRMRSKRQKILHPVGGKPMFLHVFEEAEQVADVAPVIVVAPGEFGVQALVGDRAQFVLQPRQLGTGHAAMMASEMLQDRCDQVLVTYGDMPLLRASTMRSLAEQQAEHGAAVALLFVQGATSSSFGRVVRGAQNEVMEIVEVAEARHRPDGEALLAITELNVGVYCFDALFLWERLPLLPIRQARSGQEYYLTDMVAMAVQQNRRVVAVQAEDADECLGAGTRAELVEVERAFQRRVNSYWLNSGVTLVDPASIYIDGTVQIGQDTIIWPNSFLRGQTTIGEDCEIGPGVVLENVEIPDGSRIEPFTYRTNSAT